MKDQERLRAPGPFLYLGERAMVISDGDLGRPFGLGRRYEPDDRDHAYLMRMVQPSEAEAPLVGKWVYDRGKPHDQGSTGTCVAFSWRAWMDGEPLRTRLGPSPLDLYDQCIVNDAWTDNDNDPERLYGTSVRAGAKVLTTLGHVKSYVWAFTVDDVRRWMLSGQGGVVFGVNWYSNLGNPDAEGIIRVGGRFQGGHAIYGFGADDRSGVVYLQNSWGDSWGGWVHPIFTQQRVYRGCAKLPYEDLDRLLREQGEACTATQQAVRAIPTLVL